MRQAKLSQQDILPYCSREHDNGVHRHPADGKADSDVDHGSHNVDLCLGQRRWSLLILNSTTFFCTSRLRSFHGHFISLALILRHCSMRSIGCGGSCTCSCDRFLGLCCASVTICSDLCLTTYDGQDLPVGDDEDDQR